MSENEVNIALLCGRGGSQSLKNKNRIEVLGRPLMEYPILAAQASRKLDDIYLTTDSAELAEIGERHGVKLIDRPKELATATAQHVDTLTHALAHLADQGVRVRFLVVLMCNVGIFRDGIIDECLEVLETDDAADSCVTGHIENDLHPYRVKKMGDDGYLKTWMPLENVEVSTNRQDLPSCHVIDHSTWVLRVSTCFPPTGQKPWQFMGRNIRFVDNPFCRDVHSRDDIQFTESQLKKMGWSQKVS